MRGKKLIKNRGGCKIKLRCVGMALMLLVGANVPRMAVASSCPDLRVVFARGSGGERWKDNNYLAFKSAIETKLATVNLNYEFIDLDYPAVGVGVDKLDVTLGALIGSGNAYEFGDSIKSGIKNLKNMVNSNACPGTKYVVGGYSQGAMVVSKALSSLDSSKIIYAATFGDPWIYLPEGVGVMPAACKGKNLSDYRKYVPDCYAYKGLLGANVPYRTEALVDKVGTWCNKRDVFCSSHYNVSDHLGYIADDLYDDASKVIFDKITKAFGLPNTISSPHDTAILIDSTGSMASMIEEYKAEALRLARQTLASGGRVALYDYRDLDDPYNPVEHCDFNSCTLEVFERELADIPTDGGGDDAESLLSASFHVMTSLKWKYGSTKSLVVLTDANFLAPDRDGMTFDEVVAMSKRIDPVNFYIITNSEHGDDYKLLASATDGKVVTNFDELELLTDYIMGRYDSLPRVEETLGIIDRPVLTIDNIGDSRVEFTSNGTRTIVILNGAILGVTSEKSITLTGLNSARENELTLVPIDGDVRGDAVTVELRNKSASGNGLDFLPKVPNTGSVDYLEYQW